MTQGNIKSNINHTKVWFILLFFIELSVSNAQISPGKLTLAHTSLEGIKNCTACHDLGAKISEQKCLDCHKALKTRINQNKGYHVSKDIIGKQCITCHSEHHGVKFDMIRFDEKKFNHTLTSYELKGAHKKVETCAKCHFEDHIADVKIRQNKKTFLGLDPKCISCHDDYHQKTMENDCAVCHNFDEFKPAAFFNHNKTDFPLKGAHTTVDCAKCHKTEFKSGKKFQHFADVSFKNCNNCHKDPHGGDFGLNCKSCHNESSFKNIKSTSDFNHSLTGFTLEGKHKTIECKSCHDQRSGAKGNYKEFESTKNINCLTCHKDIHNSIFGTDCKACHSQQSFSISKKIPDFNHSLTGYVLDGKHLTVDCKKCHTTPKMTDPQKHDLCAACHKDYHQGDFKDIKNRDCAVCHTTKDFKEATFDIEQHEVSSFPLYGAHMATPCTACHMKENKWTFRNVGKECIDCHQNIHIGFISEKYLPDNDCRRCHDSEAWQSITFDHNLTKFELRGNHAIIECRSCHYKDNPVSNTKEQKFTGINTNCSTCHQNVHGTQFEVEGTTDCSKCHGFEAWDRSNFNHNNAAFKLDGAHIHVACIKCHQEEWIDGTKKIKYKTGKLECIDCHQ